jgi:hypothetical protein
MSEGCINKMIWILWLMSVVSSQNTKDIEDIYKSSLLKEGARENSRFLTSKAHVASTREDEETAQFVNDQFKSFGLSTFTKEYYPLLHFPSSTQLQLLEPKEYNATLVEENSNHIPWLAYSPSADIISSLVYANYGSKQDFDLLSLHGINVTGKIVLVKYGTGFRGLKVRAAELAGAAAVLIYSDPRDDGYVRGPVYPGNKKDSNHRRSMEACIGSSKRINPLSKFLSGRSSYSWISCNKECAKDTTRESRCFT